MFMLQRSNISTVFMCMRISLQKNNINKHTFESESLHLCTHKKIQAHQSGRQEWEKLLVCFDFVHDARCAKNNPSSVICLNKQPNFEQSRYFELQTPRKAVQLEQKFYAPQADLGEGCSTRLRALRALKRSFRKLIQNMSVKICILNCVISLRCC